MSEKTPPTPQERAEEIVAIINGMTFDGEQDTWARKVTPVIRRQVEEAERMEQYNYDGAMADLDNLLTAVIARLNGERPFDTLAEYIRMKYPKRAKELRS